MEAGICRCGDVSCCKCVSFHASATDMLEPCVKCPVSGACLEPCVKCPVSRALCQVPCVTCLPAPCAWSPSCAPLMCPPHVPASSDALPANPLRHLCAGCMCSSVHRRQPRCLQPLSITTCLGYMDMPRCLQPLSIPHVCLWQMLHVKYMPWCLTRMLSQRSTSLLASLGCTWISHPPRTTRCLVEHLAVVHRIGIVPSCKSHVIHDLECLYCYCLLCAQCLSGILSGHRAEHWVWGGVTHHPAWQAVKIKGAGRKNFSQ